MRLPPPDPEEAGSNEATDEHTEMVPLSKMRGKSMRFELPPPDDDDDNGKEEKKANNRKKKQEPQEKPPPSLMKKSKSMYFERPRKKEEDDDNDENDEPSESSKLSCAVKMIDSPSPTIQRSKSMKFQVDDEKKERRSSVAIGALQRSKSMKFAIDDDGAKPRRFSTTDNMPPALQRALTMKMERPTPNADSNSSVSISGSKSKSLLSRSRSMRFERKLTDFEDLHVNRGDDDESDDDLPPAIQRHLSQRSSQLLNVNNSALSEGTEEKTPSPAEASKKLAKMIGETEMEAEKLTEPEDYYRNPAYHSDYNELLKFYLRCAMWSHDIVLNSDAFSSLMTATIIFSGILVGVESYPHLIASYAVEAIDYVIIFIFVMEFVVKVVQHGMKPWLYFIGTDWKWNWFDSLIVFMSLGLSSSNAGNSVSFLRLIRLARLGKLVKKIPALEMIMKGVVDGMTSVLPIMTLLGLVFYMFGVAGYYFFSTNDPFHFGSVGLSMVTLMRVSLFENSGDILFLNTFGCDAYNVYGLYVNSSQFNTTNPLYWCKAPQAQYLVAPIYFVLFILLAAFVVMSLFVGAISMSMSNSLDEIDKQQKEKKRQKVFDKNLDKLVVMSTGSTAKLNFSEFCERGNEGTGMNTFYRRMNLYIAYSIYFINTRLLSDPDLEIEIRKATIGSSLAVAMGWTADHNVGLKIYHPSQILYMKEVNNENQRYFFETYLYFAVRCNEIIYNERFTTFILVTAVLALVNVGFETDTRFMADPTRALCVVIAESLIVSAFILEIVLKVVSQGIHPLTYFKNSWNIFDVFVVVTSFIPNSYHQSLMFRILRLQRILKITKRMPQLSVIINALFDSIFSSGYIALILFLSFYIFAILGTTLFGKNDPWHFGSLHLSFLSLFRAVTYDNTFEVMYIQQYGCDVYKDIYVSFPELCTEPEAWGWYAVAYFLVFIIISGQVLLTLFIGVISTSLEACHNFKLTEHKFETDLSKRASKLQLSKHRVDAFRRVYDMLDLDEGGGIEGDELKFGLAALNLALEDEQFDKYLDIVDPDREGLGLIGFIDFMSLLPQYRKSLGHILGNWRSTRMLQVSPPVKKPQPLQDFFDALVGRGESRLLVRQTEAAFVIQECWAEYRKRKLLRLQQQALKRNQRPVSSAVAAERKPGDVGRSNSFNSQQRGSVRRSGSFNNNNSQRSNSFNSQKSNSTSSRRSSNKKYYRKETTLPQHA